MPYSHRDNFHVLLISFSIFFKLKYPVSLKEEIIYIMMVATKHSAVMLLFSGSTTAFCVDAAVTVFYFRNMRQ